MHSVSAKFGIQNTQRLKKICFFALMKIIARKRIKDVYTKPIEQDKVEYLLIIYSNEYLKGGTNHIFGYRSCEVSMKICSI